MNTADDPPPSPLDPAEQLSRARASWHAQRRQALAGGLPRDSLGWLHAAFDGLELALAAHDLALVPALAGEAIATALACLYGGPWAAQAEFKPADGPALRLACRPCPAHRWRDALLLAGIAGRPAHRAALARAQPAPPDTGGDAWALIAGRDWAESLAGHGDAAGRLDALRRTAASAAERAWLQAQSALRAGTVPAAPALADLPLLQGLAVDAVLQGRGQAGALAPLDVLQALQGAVVPALRLDAGERLALHPREPGWWFELYGPAGERQHRLREEAGRLVAHHEQRDAEAGIVLAARFVLADAGTPGPPALDLGELLTLADRRARATEAQPAASGEAGRRQAARMDDAVQLLDAALARLPEGRPAVASDFPSALGRAAFTAEPGRFDRERLQAVRGAYAAIAASASALDQAGAAAAAGGTVDARQAALAAIGVLRTQLEPLLWAVARDRSGAMAAALRPRDEDYARVFTPEAAAKARPAYEALFRQADIPRPADPGQTRLVCHLAPAGMLASDNELSRPFPGGWRAIADKLDPHRVWVRWKFCRPGESAGMAYDGLVWIDDHWAWFPKPYRALA